MDLSNKTNTGNNNTTSKISMNNTFTKKVNHPIYKSSISKSNLYNNN